MTLRIMCRHLQASSNPHSRQVLNDKFLLLSIRGWT
jgi:hypothetical protein